MVTSDFYQNSTYFVPILKGKDNSATYWDLALDYL